jgi:hypothetical protein
MEIDMQKVLMLPAFFVALLMGCTSQVQEGIEGHPVTMGPIAGGQRASVQTALSDGPGITALINKNYNEDTTSCTEYGSGKTRGYYFCTGVLLRTTDNGNFPPWESSPLALDLRATSYTWIRHDLNTASLYKRAGFILLSPADVLAQTVPGVVYPSYSGSRNPVVKCVYPFDAWTTRDGTDRNYYACDYENTGTGSPIVDLPWGSCDNKEGFTLATQYESQLAASGYQHWRQCSWNADNASGWRNMIASHNKLVNGNPLSYWNEVMLANFGHNPYLPAWNELMRQWVLAFFYDVSKAGGLSDAQAFQRKMAATGKRVPIVRLSFTAAAAQRFQFQQADQVAGLYP